MKNQEQDIPHEMLEAEYDIHPKNKSHVPKYTYIPLPYPETLEECLKIVERIRYESFGFPYGFLDYDYSLTKTWSLNFRNPVNFSNPDTRDKDPKIACHKMFDFLNELANKKKTQKEIEKEIEETKKFEKNLNKLVELGDKIIKDENKFILKK